jgi:hypothetical protein
MDPIYCWALICVGKVAVKFWLVLGVLLNSICLYISKFSMDSFYDDRVTAVLVWTDFRSANARISDILL